MDQVIVTRFPSTRNTKDPYHLTLGEALEAIRRGEAREQVERVRAASTAKEYSELKAQLRVYTFSGQFGERISQGLIKHSGILSMDFDDVGDAVALRQQLAQEPYILAAFLSPGGKGVKALVPIPADPDRHKQYFSALVRHFTALVQADAKCSDIPRACYESWDPDIYINWEAKQWTEADPVPDIRSTMPVLVPLLDETETERQIMEWWHKQAPMASGSRNNSAHALAVDFRNYGIPQERCRAALIGYVEPDFPEREIDAVLRSAYKHRDKFGSKRMEDRRRTDRIRSQLSSGRPHSEIAKDLRDIMSEAEAFDVIERIAEAEPWKTWWKVHKGGRIEVVHHRFRLWLESRGFRRHYPDGGTTPFLIRVTNNIVEDTSAAIIRDFTLGYLEHELQELDVYNHMAGTPKYFKDDYLSFLSPIEIQVLKDTPSTSYLFFKNTAILVTKEGVKELPYAQLEGHIWRRSIIDRDWRGGEVVPRGDFATFLDRAAGNHGAPVGDAEAEHRLLALSVAIGRMVHRYRTDYSARALIFNDTNIDDTPNGGSGKGLICRAVSKVRTVVVLDGQKMNFDSPFAYQRVRPDTEVLVLDDVPKNFSMVRIFPLITEGLEREQKNKDAVFTPVGEGPQVVITTNYAIRGQGGSYERRRWDVELSDHYNADHTPIDDFSIPFFSVHWKDKDWDDFHATIVHCVQMYLAHGMVLGHYQSLGEKQIIGETNRDFYNWASEGTLKPGARIYRRLVYDEFTERYPDYAKGGRMHTSEAMFNKWITAWARHLGYVVTEHRDSNGGRYCVMNTKDGEVAEEVPVEATKEPL